MIEDYKLTGGLSEGQLEIMHQKALDLVENHGIEIPHDGILSILSDYKGVSLGKNRIVKFTTDLVEKAISEAKYDLPSYTGGDDDWIISAGAHQTACYDLDTGKKHFKT